MSNLNYTPKRIAVKVTKSAERSIKKKHPWIFEKSIVKVSSNAQTGDLAVIFDQKNNKFIACGLYDADSVIRIKVLQFAESKTIDSIWFEHKIKAAYNLRTSLLNDTNAIRVICGENDHFPGLIADLYDTVLVIKVYSKIWFPYLSDIQKYLREVTKCTAIVLRLSRMLQQDSIPYKESEVLYGTLEKPEVDFYEHGVHFRANVLLGHKTGFFLDHRPNRHYIGQISKDKRVLDVFSYAGGFAVHALYGGASSIHCIDINPNAIAAIKQNIRLNQLEESRLTAICKDAFQAMYSLIEKKKKFDIIIIDPPAFAKKQSEIEKAKISYSNLAKLGCKLLANDGVLLLASCSSRIDMETFQKLCLNTIREEKPELNLFKSTTHDTDHPITFPEGAYLKSCYFR